MSVFEVARVRAAPGLAAELAENLRTGARIIAGGAGCRGVDVLQGVEGPEEAVLLVEWESVDAHLAFRAGDRFQRYRATMIELLDEAPDSGHFTRLASVR